MVAPLREPLQELLLHRSFTMVEKIASVITQDKVKKDYLKRQIKNRLRVLVDYSC